MTELPKQDDAIMPSDDDPNPGMTKADLLTGLLFILLGVAIFYGSWTMDRLEVRRIQALTAPGLVPGILSAALIVCGMILSLRSLQKPAPGGWQILGSAIVSDAARRALAVAALALTYTLGLVGTLPFWAATAVFVFAFIMVFECWLAEPRKPLLPSMAWALGLGLVSSGVVTLVFERAFLVRLP